jgi:hypothetical protein
MTTPTGGALPYPCNAPLFPDEKYEVAESQMRRYAGYILTTSQVIC